MLTYWSRRLGGLGRMYLINRNKEQNYVLNE